MRQYKNLQELHTLVAQWGKDRNFFAPDGATYEGQWMKLFEELGELALGINKKKINVIKDSIGDALVVCIMLQHIADRQNKLTELSKYDLFANIGEYYNHLPHVRMYFILNDCVWLNPANTSTTRYGFYLQRIVASLADMAISSGFALNECLEAAYEEIKDRKGQMVHGVFIKEEDLVEA